MDERFYLKCVHAHLECLMLSMYFYTGAIHCAALSPGGVMEIYTN